jgi:hypothetical protein
MSFVNRTNTTLKTLLPRFSGLKFKRSKSSPVTVCSTDTAKVRYWEKFVPIKFLERVTTQLELPGALTQKPALFGHKTPRFSGAYGDSGLIYSYSKTTEVTRPWTSRLKKLKRRVEKVTGESYNFVLVNRYDGLSHHVPWHSDDERDLEKDSSIASVTFGAKRDFQLKLNQKGRQKIITLPLASGSLVEMGGTTQREFLHRLRKGTGETGVRYNLTFRKLVPRNK